VGGFDPLLKILKIRIKEFSDFKNTLKLKKNFKKGIKKLALLQK